MILTALVGLFGIGGGLIGYLNAPIKSYWRLLLVAGGLGLLIPVEEKYRRKSENVFKKNSRK